MTAPGIVPAAKEGKEKTTMHQQHVNRRLFGGESATSWNNTVRFYFATITTLVVVAYVLWLVAHLCGWDRP